MRLDPAAFMVVGTLCLLTGLAAPAASQAPADVAIRSVPVAGNVTVLMGAGGNVGVSAGPDGLLVVDDDVAAMSAKLEAALADLGGDVVFVLNTHWHHDHVGGNETLGPRSTIVAHANTRRRLTETIEILGMRFEALATHGLPVVTFGDSLSIHFNGEEIRAVHMPRGHTDGDVAIWFTGSNVVHMGDQFFNGMFPFIDLVTGGDIEGYAANVEKVLSEIPEDARVIPGHGPIGTVDDLRRFQAMLAASIAMVREGISAGRSVEELQAAGLPGLEGWGEGFISTPMWIGIVHAGLTGSSGLPASAHGHEER